MAKISAKTFIHQAEDYAKKGEWGKVDNEIVPQVHAYRAKILIPELYGLFRSKNADVRDLAGTLAAKVDVKQLSEKERLRLRGLLQKTLGDEHVYARFRASLALLELGLYEPKDVSAIEHNLKEIKEKEKDPSLQELAQKYLERLKH